MSADWAVRHGMTNIQNKINKLETIINILLEIHPELKDKITEIENDYEDDEFDGDGEG